MDGNKSEVARLRQQIELEYVAATRGLRDYAYSARHDFIETRMSNMGDCHRELIDLVGEHEAIKLIVEIIDQDYTGECSL